MPSISEVSDAYRFVQLLAIGYYLDGKRKSLDGIQ